MTLGDFANEEQPHNGRPIARIVLKRERVFEIEEVGIECDDDDYVSYELGADVNPFLEEEETPVWAAGESLADALVAACSAVQLERTSGGGRARGSLTSFGSRGMLVVGASLTTALSSSPDCSKVVEPDGALDRSQHKALTQEAAERFAAAGDYIRAQLAAERLMTTHPFDIDAVDCATAIVLAACDSQTAGRWLRRALGAWAASSVHAPREAELWRRLGDIERAQRRPANARAAYKRARAYASSPDSPVAVAAHRALFELTPPDRIAGVPARSSARRRGDDEATTNGQRSSTMAHSGS
jgi:hypothetical protein